MAFLCHPVFFNNSSLNVAIYQSNACETCVKAESTREVRSAETACSCALLGPEKQGGSFSLKPQISQLPRVYYIIAVITVSKGA